MKIFGNIDIPNDAVTQTWGFLGHKGSGKTYTATKVVEVFLEHGCQTIILDPVGIWYGLRLLDNNKPSKFEIPILGGLRGDIELQHSAGRTVADFVADTGSSAILDVSLFRKNQRKEFVAEFMEQIFLRHKKVPRPIHLVLEECQVFCPQKLQPGEQRMLSSIEDVVKIGRNVGIGISLISQRAQSVNKEVLNQCEPLLVFRTIGKLDRTAIEQWADHVDMEAAQSLKRLPELQPGDCYFWSPSWLRKFKKTRALQKITSDVSSTPKLGQTYVERKLKPVDLVVLKGAMSAVEEKRLAETNKGKSSKAAPEGASGTVSAESEAKLASAHVRIAQLETENKAIRETYEAYQQLVIGQVNALHESLSITGDLPPLKRPPTGSPINSSHQGDSTLKTPKATNVVKPVDEAYVLKPGQVKVLRSLYWLKNEDITAQKVAYYSGYTVNGNFNNIMSGLRSKGFVEGWKITSDGEAGLNMNLTEIEEKPTGHDLLEWMCSRLNSEDKLLRVLYGLGGERISVALLAEQSGYRVSGHFNNMLSRLRSLGAVEGGNRDGGVRISDLFLELR